MRNLGMALIAAALLVAGCSSDESTNAKPEQEKKPAPPPVETKPAEPPPAPPKLPTDEPVETELPGLGYTIKVPGTWKMKEISKTSYHFKVPVIGGHTDIPSRMDVNMGKAPSSVGAASKACPAKVLEKKTLDDGRFYYVCEQTAVGRTLRNFQYIIKTKTKGKAIMCTGNGADITPMLEACKTMAAK